jgi:hypothetical protein
MGADRGIGVGHAADRLLDLTVDLGRGAGGGFGGTASAAGISLNAADPWPPIAAKVFGTVPIAFLI